MQGKRSGGSCGVTCCRYSHHSPLSHCVPCWVTAISPPVEGGWGGGGTPQPLLPPLRMPPAAVVITLSWLSWLSHPRRCTCRHWGCGCLPAAVVILGALPHCCHHRQCMVGQCGSGCLPARPRSCGVPPGRRCGVGAPPTCPCHRGCLPLVLEAVGASSLILMVVWCPLGDHHGRASPVVIMAVSPVIVVAMGAPARPRGRVVPPWSSSWPCLSGGRHGCVPSHHRGHGCPRLSSWSCGVVPWCPAWRLVLPGHCGGHVVTIWCLPARPCGHVVPPGHRHGHHGCP